MRIFLLLVLLLTQLNIGFTKEDYPRRIISLGTTLTEELYLLGAQDLLIANTIYCQRPSEAKEKEKIGTVVEVNLEKIVGLKPDLVLATSLTNLKTIEKLKHLGIKVAIFAQPKNFTQICGQFLELARLAGKEEQAQETIKEAKEKVDFIKERVKGLDKPKVFLQLGAKPLFAATAGSFLNDFIEFAAGINIVSQTSSGLYSREEVIKSNPEVIIISTMGIVGEKEKEIWLKYKTLKAAQDNRIYIIDSYKLCSPTPVSFAQTLEEIVKILHPQNG